MFGILENIALEQAKLEFQKGSKKKVDPKKIQKKKNQLLSGSFTAKKSGPSLSSNKARVNRETTASMQISQSRSKSISVKFDRSQSAGYDDLAKIGRGTSGEKGFGMSFEDNEEEKDDSEFMLDSPTHSESSSSVINVDPNLLIEYDEEDDFEDANETSDFVEASQAVS
jgi:hypothetical protein